LQFGLSFVVAESFCQLISSEEQESDEKWLKEKIILVLLSDSEYLWA